MSIDLFATTLFSTVACLIFLFSTIPTLLQRRFFSNHEMGGRRMLFLPMRCFLRFYNKLRSSSVGPRALGFPELLVLVVDDLVALPLDRDLLSQPLSDDVWVCQGWLFLPGDYPAIYKITHFLQACGLTLNRYVPNQQNDSPHAERLRE